MLKKIRFPLLIFFAWQLLILLFQIFVQPHYIITRDSETLFQRLFISWTSYWDAIHYLTIAATGYEYPKQAFFPLWPLLIKTVALVGLPIAWVSYLLTFILSVLNFILLFLLGKKLIGEQKAKWSLIFFSCYPAAIFLHAGYSENLFLFLSLLSFLLLENKKYYLSAICAGFVTACRIPGIAVTATFLFIKTSIKNKIFMLLVGSLGLLAYMLFLYIHQGDFLYFIKAQQNWCGPAGRCGFTSPLKPVIDYLNLLWSGSERIGISFRFIDWFSSVVFLSLLGVVFKKLPKTYFLYSLIILLMPLSSGSTASMVRITLTAFPIFLILPGILRNNYLKILLALGLLFVEFRFVALFSSYLWVA